jgi:hypothetical protein
MENKPVRPWDLFNKNKERVLAQVKEDRMAICRNCEFFIALTNQCTKCGCIMPLKASLAEAECPIHKWGQVDTEKVPFTDE